MADRANEVEFGGCHETSNSATRISSCGSKDIIGMYDCGIKVTGWVDATGSVCPSEGMNESEFDEAP